MAFEHLRAGGTFVTADPSLVAVDRDVAAAALCAMGAAGLLVTRARVFVAASIVLGTAYMLSARRLGDTLGYDALTHLPVVLAALFVYWPPLARKLAP